MQDGLIGKPNRFGGSQKIFRQLLQNEISSASEFYRVIKDDFVNFTKGTKMRQFLDDLSGYLAIIATVGVFYAILYISFT